MSFAPLALGAQASSFTISSDASNTADVTVNLAGTGGTNISVSPLSINFGTVPVGQSAGPVPVTIGNTGTGDLSISAISAPAGDFAVVHSPPLVLPAGGTTTVNAFFSPLSPGSKTSSFDILSDAIDTPSVTVALQGLGIVPPANDLCTNAFPLTCGQSITGTTQLATFDDVGTCTTSNTAPGVWYTVTGTGAPTTVSTCAGATYDTKISVFSGSCGTLTCVGGNDDGCGLRSSVTFNSVAGQAYYVLVHGFLNQTGDFTLSTSQCPAQISVTPTDLSFDLPPNGTASSQMSLANTADAGALDLSWATFSREGVPTSVAGAQPTVDTSPVAVFQVTDATLSALQSGGAPPVIRNSLRNLRTLIAEYGHPEMLRQTGGVGVASVR